MAKNETNAESRQDGERADSRLETISAQQRNILSALSMVLDVLRAQGKMLQQLTAMAREESASSPILDSINDLTNAIVTMDGSLQSMAEGIEELPRAIAAELARRDGAGSQGTEA